MLFDSVDEKIKTITRAEIPDPIEQKKYDKLESYVRQFDGELSASGDGKINVIAAGATEILKLYRSGIYEKEKASYTQLETSGANMDNFVAQHDWDDETRTARAETLASTSAPNGDHTIAARAILTDLSEHGLFLNDLDRGDNIGTSANGRAVVFDVKSLVPVEQAKYPIP